MEINFTENAQSTDFYILYTSKINKMSPTSDSQIEIKRFRK